MSLPQGAASAAPCGPNSPTWKRLLRRAACAKFSASRIRHFPPRHRFQHPGSSSSPCVPAGRRGHASCWGRGGGDASGRRQKDIAGPKRAARRALPRNRPFTIPPSLLIHSIPRAEGWQSPVDCDGLENRWGFTPPGGSNPSPSASSVQSPGGTIESRRGFCVLPGDGVPWMFRRAALFSDPLHSGVFRGYHGGNSVRTCLMSGVV